MNNILSRFGIYSYCFLSLIAQAYSQSKTVDSIRLVNASFEDTPKQSSPPMGWTDCGFTGESAPDVHPSNFWQVSKPAFNGRTYMGLVVRHNDTWERVSQMLESPLVGGQCYNFSIWFR